MLNFAQLISRAATSAGDKPVLAAPYPLSKIICRELVSAGVIGGYVANERPGAGKFDLAISGWWIDRHKGSWFIRDTSAETIILLGGTSYSDVSTRMLLEARLKGLRRVLLLPGDGPRPRDLHVCRALPARVGSGTGTNPSHVVRDDPEVLGIAAVVRV